MQFNKTFVLSFAVHANDLDAFIPEFWAQESLAVLEESLVAANLVHRDFENTLAQMGDTVNCRRPNRFEPFRKDLTDNVTIQDATATNVPVVLNQHVHTSFLIRDGEESKSMTDLITEYIGPAVKGMARWTDRMVLGQYGQFVHNNAGQLGGLSGTTAKSYVIAARKRAETLKWPDEIRPMIVNQNAEANLLNTDLFVSSEKAGNSTALETADMGRKFGFRFYQTQQMGLIVSGNTKRTGAVNLAAGYAAGSTVLVVDGFTGTIAAGSGISIDGYPHWVVSSTATLGNATGITISRGLPAAVLDNAVIDVYTPGAVNAVAGYAVGYSKAIVVDTFSVAPQVGQMVSFAGTPSTTTPIYTILGIDVSTTSITLDRPLEVALVDNDTVNIGPAGDYSFSFLRDAIALVVRPLAAPKAGTGARSAVVNYNGLSMRATITYDGNKQGHLVTLDYLAGIKVLDNTFGLVMLG